jgi:ribosomal protein L40E
VKISERNPLNASLCRICLLRSLRPSSTLIIRGDAKSGT